FGILGRWPLRHMHRQPLTREGASAGSHFPIDPLPERLECAQRRERQDELAAGLQMCDESLQRFEAIWTEEHDRKVARDAVERTEARGQHAHVVARELQPRERIALDPACACDLPL